MKKVFYLLLAFTLVLSTSSCEKEVDNSAELCSNGRQDVENGETEKDCGGNCDACPDPENFICTMTSLNGSSAYDAIDIGGLELAKNIRIYAADSLDRQIDFAFSGKTVGSTTPVAYGGFYFEGQHHTFGLGDTGTVTVTAIDTVHRVVSGTFGMSATRDRSTRKAQLSSGTFTNVRY